MSAESMFRFTGGSLNVGSEVQVDPQQMVTAALSLCSEVSQLYGTDIFTMLLCNLPTF